MKLIEIKFSGTRRTFYITDKLDFQKQIKDAFALRPHQYYLTDGYRLLPKSFNFEGPYQQSYFFFIRTKGGGFPGGDILKPITGPIKGILDAVVGIGKFFIMLFKVALWLGKVFAWVFTDFLNPKLFLVDIATSIITVLRIMILGVIDAISGFFRKMVNMIFGPITKSFWGWTPPGDKQTKGKKCKGQKCYAQPDARVPIPVLLGTVVMPPMGLFMELGLKGWMNILICAILTLGYYFPGLIYALIILYC